MVLVDVVEESVSGSAPMHKRPKLASCLQRLNSNTALICWKRDRLSRDTLTYHMVDADARKRGSMIMSVKETNGSDPADVLMTSILTAFASYEVSMIRQRISAALGNLKTTGKKYTREKYGVRWEEGSAVLVEEEVVVLKTIARLRGTGLSYAKVAAHLSSLDLKTRHGKEWSRHNVQGVFMSEEKSPVTKMVTANRKVA
jgi:DNA invertase Pin-like site-specific DNA recombinase